MAFACLLSIALEGFDPEGVSGGEDMPASLGLPCGERTPGVFGVESLVAAGESSSRDGTYSSVKNNRQRKVNNENCTDMWR